MFKFHDETTNATYIVLNETADRAVAKTVEVSEICNVDIDKDGFPIGIEIIAPPNK